MQSMFSSCSGLTELNVSSFDTSQVTNMSYMFMYSRGLISLDLSGWNTSQVTNMQYMFYSCSGLTTIYVSEYDETTGTGWTTSAVTSSTNMFNKSTKLVGQNGTAYDSNHTDAEYARIDKEGEPGYLTDITNKVNRLVLAEYGASTTNYLGSTITKDKIESIKFEKGTTMEAISSFDASEYQNGSVMGYYTDTDNDGLYELTFLSEVPIAPNKNGQYLFQNLTNVTEITFNNFSTFGVTSMYSMFYYCSVLENLDISRFDTSQVTDMSWMFSYCSVLTELDVSGFDTSKVTNMSNMFAQCKGVSQLDVSGFNTSKVTNMGSMFSNCSGVTKLDVSQFDTSKVTNMSSMFMFCSKLTELDVSKFNTSQVTTMSQMFFSCSLLTGLDVSKFDTRQVTSINNMFDNCSKLTELDVSGFNTSKVTNMQSMFSSCSGLTKLDVSNFDTSKVTGMNNMFYACKGLTELDLSNFNTNQVTNMGFMFYNCSNLTTIYVSEYDATTGTGWTTSAVTNSSSMFSGCSKLVGQNGTAYSSSHIDAEYARIDKSGAPGYLTDINKPLSPSELFDSEGTNPDGLHIGDFVNYDAGTWTQAEINSIKTGLKTNLVTANNSTALPTQDFQFGGFTAGSSRNGNATPSSTSYNYVKDAETGQAITGWRILDVEGDTVTLISAGNPEDYKNSSENNNSYISEYILTGNINSNWNNGTTKAGNYQKRNWDMYINRNQYGASARVLTKAILDTWYTKYTDTSNADTYITETFRKIYQAPYTKYQNMIENYSYYWICTTYSNYSMYSILPNVRSIDGSGGTAYGVRVVITLSTDAKFESTKAGTKTVTGGNTSKYGGNQTYNVWNLY